MTADDHASILQGRRCLIAEDDLIISLLLQDVIESCGGVVVATASSCDVACAKIETEKLDIVILDVHLKGSVSEDVLELALSKHVAVLISTGSDPHDLPLAFQQAPVLKKPWLFEDAERALLLLCQFDA